MARKRSMILPGTHTHYVTEYTVYPNQGSKEITDTMLVQFFVLMYFTLTSDTGSDLVAAKNEFFALYDSVNARQKRDWIDGKYGPNTRKGVLLFERCIMAPYKDGIVRPVCEPKKIFRPTLSVDDATKLETMNWHFNKGTEGKIVRQMGIFRSHSPALYARFFS